MGDAGAPLPRDGDVADPRLICFDPVLPCQSVILGEPYERNYGDLREQFDPCVPPFKVTGTNMDRSAT